MPVCPSCPLHIHACFSSSRQPRLQEDFVKLLPRYSRTSHEGAHHTGIKDLKDFLLPTVMWCWVYRNHVFYNISASVRTKSKTPLFARFSGAFWPFVKTLIFVKHACKAWYKHAALSPILSLPVFKTDKQKNTLFCRPMVMEK